MNNLTAQKTKTAHATTNNNNNGDSNTDAITNSAADTSSTGGGFVASLSDNPLFTAGAGVAGIGVALGLVRQGKVACVFCVREQICDCV